MSDQTVAHTILNQLGGSRFAAMTGAKNLQSTPTSLQFQIGRALKRINRVTIELTGADLYNITFSRYSPTNLEVTEVEKVDGLFNDQLRPVFERVTGLRTSL
jgi:hypothetical protein